MSALMFVVEELVLSNGVIIARSQVTRLNRGIRQSDMSLCSFRDGDLK